MPTRIKLFSNSVQRDLEDQVNAFLAELAAGGGRLIDAQFAAPVLQAGPNHMAVLVVYEPGSDGAMGAAAAAAVAGGETVVIGGPGGSTER